MSAVGSSLSNPTPLILPTEGVQAGASIQTGGGRLASLAISIFSKIEAFTATMKGYRVVIGTFIMGALCVYVFQKYYFKGDRRSGRQNENPLNRSHLPSSPSPTIAKPDLLTTASSSVNSTKAMTSAGNGSLSSTTSKPQPVVANTVQNVRRPTSTPPPLSQEPFQSFTISISEDKLPPISSEEEMHTKAKEVGQHILNKHIKLRIDIPFYGTERKQALKFIEELKTFVDVISIKSTNEFYVVPKKKEELQERLTIREYNSRVIEEVQSSQTDAWDCWQGRRIYPNGVIETGKFYDFCWQSGTSVEKEVTTYRRPNILANSHSLDRGLMYAGTEEKKQLIVIQKKSGPYDLDYVQINEELIPTLAEILKKEYVREEVIQEILSGPINCEEFFKFLFETNFIFSLGAFSLEKVLKIIQNKKLTVDLRQQDPTTKKTLLNCYPDNASITQTLLAIDPTLTEEAELILLKQFKKKLISFLTHNKNSQQIAEELFKNIPKGLELTELVNFIFKKCSGYDILPFLDAILITHSSFTLSPYDTIRKAIVEDKDHSLTNRSLIDMLKEHSLDTDEEKITACGDLAYRLNHPYVYSVSQTPVPTSDYSLNFLWVNLNPQDRIQDVAQNIFKDGLDPSENASCIKDRTSLLSFEGNEKSQEKEDLENREKIKKSFAYRISKWADVHPGAQINLWYDSALVTQKAQQKTFEMMKSISESRGVNLELKDIRQLPNIDGEIGNALHPGTQVYYRVDLLKVLITDYMMSSSKESAKYCVVSDIDVEPMTPQHMFDQRTLDYLSTNGYVFNRVSLMGDFKNSFFIFNKEKKDLKKIHNKVIIQQTASNIAELREYPINKRFHSEYILGAQSVFNLYRYFREEMGEKRNRTPRKVVKCPKSQFNLGGSFSKSDYQSETFRFIGSSNIPYTRHGRNFDERSEEGQIKELVNWKAEPLPEV